MKRGDKVVVQPMGLPLSAWAEGLTGEIAEVRKFIGLPYLVKFADGRTLNLGHADVRRAS